MRDPDPEVIAPDMILLPLRLLMPPVLLIPVLFSDMVSAIVMLLLSRSAAPELIVVPLLVPVAPSALLCRMFKTPALMVVLPVQVLFPPKTSVPAPAFDQSVLPASVLLIVSVRLAFTEIEGAEPPTLTVPLSIAKLPEPAV